MIKKSIMVILVVVAVICGFVNTTEAAKLPQFTNIIRVVDMQTASVKAAVDVTNHADICSAVKILEKNPGSYILFSKGNRANEFANIMVNQSAKIKIIARTNGNPVIKVI